MSRFLQDLGIRVDALLDGGPFMPHGYCLYWRPELLYMHVVSDLAIALAYFSIPVTILVLLKKRRRPLPYRWVFVFFALFIFLCGASHLVELVTLWYPVYYLEGFVKVATATTSVATALLMFPLVRELVDRFGQPQAPVAGGDLDGA